MEELCVFKLILFTRREIIIEPKMATYFLDNADIRFEVNVENLGESCCLDGGVHCMNLLTK